MNTTGIGASSPGQPMQAGNLEHVLLNVADLRGNEAVVVVHELEETK